MSPGRSRLAIVLPWLWLAVFFAVPFALVAKLSLSDTALAIPPYAPRLDWTRGLAGVADFIAGLDLETYARLPKDSLYLDAYLSSLRLAGLATLILLVIGYPIAYGLARCREPGRRALVMAVML